MEGINQNNTNGGYAPPPPNAPAGTPVDVGEYTNEPKPPTTTAPLEPTKRRGRPPRGKEPPSPPTGEALPPPLGDLPVVHPDTTMRVRMQEACEHATQSAIYSLLEATPNHERGQAAAWMAIGKIQAAHTIMNWGRGALSLDPYKNNNG